jgi:ribosomal protein S12 methylthiotransferase
MRRLISMIALIDKVCKSIDIPLQQRGSAAMKFKCSGRAKAHRGAVTNIEGATVTRISMPRTTFISGFPSKTEADHEELMDAIKVERQ